VLSGTIMPAKRSRRRKLCVCDSNLKHAETRDQAIFSTTRLHRPTRLGIGLSTAPGKEVGGASQSPPRPRVYVSRARRVRHAGAGCACQTQHIPLLTFPGTQPQRHGLSPPCSGGPLTNTQPQTLRDEDSSAGLSTLRPPCGREKKLRRRSTPCVNNPESRLLPLLQGAGAV